jgi:hypothetical protein
MTVGTKAQVFHGTADRTAGGLKKDDLMKTAAGRIVSKKAHAAGLKAIQRLRAAGFVAKKGEFKLFSKRGSKKAASPKGRKMMTRANHKKRHNAAVKAWTTRRSKKPTMGGRRSTRRRFF